MVEKEEKAKEFIESLGNVECHKGTFVDAEHHLSGYHYACEYKYHDIHFTLYVDSVDSNNIYIKSTIENSNEAEEFLSKLSEAFNVDLNKLRFSTVRFDMFRVQMLPEEIINLTTDNDKIYLSMRDDRIFLSIEDNIYLLFDQDEHKFIILGIKNWESYKKIRGSIDQDVRELLDKLSLSQPEFRLETYGGKLSELEGKRKENVLWLLNKLTPIIEKIKINKIIISDDKVILNNILLVLENDWEVVVPVNDIEKLLLLDTPVSIELHRDFWLIKVHRDYLSKVTNALNIEPIYITNTKKISPFFDRTENYYVFTMPDDDYDDDYYYIISSSDIKKHLLTLGIKIVQQDNNVDNFEIINDSYKYVIIKGERGDEIHIKVYRQDKFLTSLRTYLWYFGVKDFSELKNLNKEKVVDIINRQIKERYFYPMPFSRVEQYVMTLIDNTINRIDEAINDVKNKIPSFTKPIKNITSISCLFDKNCEVKLELDEIGSLSSYYSLLSTSQGHLPVPIFLEYAGIETESSCDNEGDISDTKNIIYFIRGYDESIQEDRREYYLPDDNVRGAESELFQKAVVLYNKLTPPTKRKLYYIEDEEVREYYIDEEDEENECPEYALPDGFGYCRDFDYQPLMQKTEDELANDIIESLTKIREKMVNIREKMLKSDSLPVIETW